MDKRLVKAFFWIVFISSMSYGIYKFFYLGDYNDNLLRFKELGMNDSLECIIIDSSNQHGWTYFITDKKDSLFLKPSHNYSYSENFDMSLAMSLKKGDSLIKRSESDSLIVVKPTGKRLVYILGKTIE